MEVFEVKKKVKKKFTTIGKSLETLNYEARLHLKTLNQLLLPGGQDLCANSGGSLGAIPWDAFW